MLSNERLRLRSIDAVELNRTALASPKTTFSGVPGVAGIASLSQIIIADLVPLQERGTYNGLVAL